ncbi:hypothetical protein KQX54_002130 [Cotesia glomerata]|uniref:Uncharacterized protein n=1 Tax=Cotesia glomerata TaxID=32391 RepID=A0AAV7I3V7_COTGL|nr:hypothetical protein KQX54_002130 [Cotesia glomerata]
MLRGKSKAERANPCGSKGILLLARKSLRIIVPRARTRKITNSRQRASSIPFALLERASRSTPASTVYRWIVEAGPFRALSGFQSNSKQFSLKRYRDNITTRKSEKRTKGHVSLRVTHSRQDWYGARVRPKIGSRIII